jgi:hypothetical protein
VLMGATFVYETGVAKRVAETIRNDLGDVREALGRPTEFFPKRLSEDDGRYFYSIANHIDQTVPGDTIWIVTSHRSATERLGRTKAVNAGRKRYHEAIEDRALHGVHVRRILCFDESVSADLLEARFFSRYTTDHCKRLEGIAKSHPDAVSIRMCRYYTGNDFMVIPGRVAAVTADARDRDGMLKHVLCWMYFNPPNGNVINTLEEWCQGLDNDSDPIRSFPDGIIETPLNEECS